MRHWLARGSHQPPGACLLSTDTFQVEELLIDF